jgi:6-pyruvoyltetrahydropterin/6-carboxytetrahydropterin synthase
VSRSTIIAKEFRWEMGHRLPHHGGLCRNIHGHSYEAHVKLEGMPDASGMVMDYFDVKTMVQPIIDELDHCFLCDSSDTVMMEFFASNPMKVVTIDAPSTAENIAALLLQRIADRLPARHSITNLWVRVYETEKTYAEVTMNLGTGAV